MAEYAVYLDRDDGTRLALLDNFVTLDYTMVRHDVGACSIVLPGTFDRSLLAPDRRIEIWRAAEPKTEVLERVYMIRKLTDATDGQGRRTIAVIGYDGNYLLKGRIVAYDEGTAQADMTDEADDMCKAIVTDNHRGDATAARQISSSYLTVQADLTAGPSITLSFAHQNVLSVLQDIVEAARTAGTDIFWDMVPVSPAAWEFRTNTGQLGQDHTYPNGQNPVVLALEYGNLAEPVLEEDWTEEANFAYSDAAITAEDTTRSGRSVFGRREMWVDTSAAESEDGITGLVNAAISANRPRLRLTAKVVDNAQTRYGKHYRFGDLVTASYAGRQWSAHIRAVSMHVDEHGKETPEIRLETTE